MPETDEVGQPAKVKAVLIDADSGEVLWLNESAAQDAAGASAVGLDLSTALPIAATLGVPDVLASVAATGEPRHLRTGLVSTSKGSLEIVASVYRVMEGRLLLLMENVWQPGRAPAGGGESRSGRRRTR